jgi:phosphoribosylamine---glycine ligase
MTVRSKSRQLNIMALGVGAFTQSMLRILREHGANVCTYLTRSYAHYAPSCEGPVFDSAKIPDPTEIIRRRKIDFLLPQSIDWAQQPWAENVVRNGVRVFCPTGEALNLERDRDFARQLSAKFSIPFPRSYVARNASHARQILKRDPRPYVVKNPLCGPGSPVHTIVCETVQDTASWLDRIDYSEGVFLQEYMGRAEAGHIALVSGGEIHSLVTNQEYKRAFDGNMGIVAGAPLGGLIQRDEKDRYGLARELLRPLLPWFRETNFHGPVQVTAIRRGGKWHVVEYNVRIGVTSGPMILRMLADPLDVLWRTVGNEPLDVKFKRGLTAGCSITLAGFGYPYVQVNGPQVPVEVRGKLTCDVWWNEVAADANSRLHMTGHRIADVAAVRETMRAAIAAAYENIARIRCLGSYYRTDVGASLWPPGNE